MALEHRLVQTQSQKLVLSPQLKQFIKLLPLPLIELQNHIQQELAENPVLEEDIEYELDSTVPENDSQIEKNDELDFQETFDKLQKLDEEFKSSIYSEEQSRHESINELDKKHDFQQSLITNDETLGEYLLWQAQFLEFTEDEFKIAKYIIDNLDSNGYLKIKLLEIAEKFKVQENIVNSILLDLQNLEPIGICARNLQECLLIQLNTLPATKSNKTATIIVEKHFKLLEKKDFPALSRKLLISEENIKKACAVITNLEPKPGRTFFQNESTIITPDAAVYPNPDDESKYIVEIHNDHIPRLKISTKYKQMLSDKTLDLKTKEYLKSKINGALWFIKAIDQRKSTLMEITENLVKEQYDFFDKGFAFLNPLRLKDISRKLNVHESTISRAVSDKYISTPQGTIPYKMFFSNKIRMDDGTLESQTSIMEKIKHLINSEDPKKPHSDSKLATLLQGQGIQIARRTIAKYREQLKILPSNMRREK